MIKSFSCSPLIFFVRSDRVIVGQRPFRRLAAIFLGRRTIERRDAAAARGATFFGER